AKPIRIRIVSGGEEHSSIETLRDNYSLKDILPRVKDGQLYKWLNRIGETKAAEIANNLKCADIEATSKSMIALTALIFNTTADSIEDLQRLWLMKYPKTLSNYVKIYSDTFKDITLVRQLYDSLKEYTAEISVEKWQDIFVTTLKRMHLSKVLEDFKKFKSRSPMSDIAWLKVLKYHSDSASDEELYIIAQVAYEQPKLKKEAEEWYIKSARSHIKAKEWVNKNIKRLDPKEEELFNAFKRYPSRFSKESFNINTYPEDLVNFLDALSSGYSSNQRQFMSWNTKKYGKYSKYILLIEKLYDMTYWRDKSTCIKGLKKLPMTESFKDYFKDYKTLDRIIDSLENEKPLFGQRLWELDYKKIVLFIAGLAKKEMENEK
ncbi:MAG: hypothetical protein K2K32_03120, partial [Muribaculaceae bacterium]|nr:hypothetical protein [Muribaculaceae bacterium]